MSARYVVTVRHSLVLSKTMLSQNTSQILSHTVVYFVQKCLEPIKHIWSIKIDITSDYFYYIVMINTSSIDFYFNSVGISWNVLSFQVLEAYQIQMILINMYKEVEVLVTTVICVTTVKHSLVLLETMLSPNISQTHFHINALSVTKTLEQIRHLSFIKTDTTNDFVVVYEWNKSFPHNFINIFLIWYPATFRWHHKTRGFWKVYDV